MEPCMWADFCLLWLFVFYLPTVLVAVPIRSDQSTQWRVPEHIVQLTIDENCRIGTSLGTVAAALLPVTDEYPVWKTEVKYTFGSPSSLFVVDEQTGLVTTIAAIDAEALCAKAHEEKQAKAFSGQIHEKRTVPDTDHLTCTQSGHLTIHIDINTIDVDSTLVSVFRTLIHVKDLNDNWPVFDRSRWQRRLKESLYQKGRRLDLPKAHDNDITFYNNQIRYRLESSVKNSSNNLGPFALEISSTGYPGLVLMEDLDAELSVSYNLVLIAYSPLPMDATATLNSNFDGALQSESHLEIEIEVEDMNDNEPHFAKSTYNVSVSEDTPLNSVIYQLVAYDKDRSANLTYSIMDSEKGTLVDSIFYVTHDGIVRLRGALDYELRQIYQIPVEVKDGEFDAHTTLVVNVLDVNDEPPRFEVNPKQIVVVEHAAPGKLVGQVRVYDPDGDAINGKVKCHEPSDVERKQALAFLPDPRLHPFTSVYDLTTRVLLDRESDLNHSGGHLFVYLVCTDGNEMQSEQFFSKQHTSTMTVTLTVRDENDHVPLFDQAIYNVGILEHNMIGERLIQVHASDKDEGANAKVVYSLLDRANFQIDQTTGWITANRIFDRELRDSYQVTVIATDRGVPPMSSSALLNLTVLDLNDHAPRLFSGEYSQGKAVALGDNRTVFHVLENAPSNTYIGDVQATDEDFAENAEIQYYLIENEEQQLSSRFRLLENGSLFTNAILDREEQTEYHLVVLLKDRSFYNALATTGTVTVLVTDVNDNPPTFLHPKGLLHMDHSQSISDVSTENTYLLYDQPMVNSNDSMMKEKNAAFFTDLTVPSVTQNSSFPKQNIIRIFMHEEPGYLVTTLLATDPDEGENGKLVYQVEELPTKQYNKSVVLPKKLNNFLRADSDRGHIILSRKLDGSDLGIHLVRVTASDLGKPISMNTSKIMVLLIEKISNHEVVHMSKQSGTNEKWFLLFIGLPLLIVALMVVAVAALVERYKHRFRPGRYLCCAMKAVRDEKLSTKHYEETVSKSSVKDAYSTINECNEFFEQKSFIPMSSKVYNHSIENRHPSLREDTAQILGIVNCSCDPVNLSSAQGTAIVQLVGSEPIWYDKIYLNQTLQTTPDLLVTSDFEKAHLDPQKDLMESVSPKYINVFVSHENIDYPKRDLLPPTSSTSSSSTNKSNHLTSVPPDNAKSIFLPAVQTVFEQIKQTKTAQFVPWETSLLSNVQDVSRNDLHSPFTQEPAASSKTIGGGISLQPVQLTAAPSVEQHSLPGNQLELCSVLMTPEQIVPYQVVNVLVKEDDNKDSGCSEGQKNQRDPGD